MTSALAVRDLTVEFPARGRTVTAVDGLSLELAAGETLALVGESGSGKSTALLGVLGLVPPPGRVRAASIRLGERELTGLPERELRRLRGDRLAVVFQDSLSALNPLLPVGLQLAEVLEVHRGLRRREALARAARALGEVGLAEPEALLARHPHELSGGMRQRACIAMALLCEPEVLFADEPTTALDAAVKRDVQDLLARLQRRRGTAVVFVTHDLSAVRGRADRVLVLYAGRAAEEAPTSALFERPLHPYARGLLASLPRLDDDPASPLGAIPGAPPDPSDPPPGCAFGPRCPLARERCARERPALVPAGPGRTSACLEWRRLAEAAP